MSFFSGIWRSVNLNLAIVIIDSMSKGLTTMWKLFARPQHHVSVPLFIACRVPWMVRISRHFLDSKFHENHLDHAWSKGFRTTRGWNLEVGSRNWFFFGHAGNAIYQQHIQTTACRTLEPCNVQMRVWKAIESSYSRCQVNLVRHI